MGTFDKRLTWKQQTETAEAIAKVLLALMKKVAGTTWGADIVTLRRLYSCRARPVLEYGMTAMGTAANPTLIGSGKYSSSHLMIAGISNCFTRLPNSGGCKTTL